MWADLDIAYITHQIFAPASALRASDYTQMYPLAMTERFVSEFTKLEASYCCWRRESNWRILLLLQYQHAMLNRFQEFLRRYRKEYADYRQHMFDARKSQLRQWGLNQLTNDSYQQRYVQRTGEEMIATLELLLELAAKSMEGSSSVDAKHRASFGLLAVELQGACKDLTARFQAMADDLDHHLKFLDLSRNMRQADSVGMLTVLATIFLPMSLGASVLSMSTRFKDVGVLLYDLFGVVVLISVVIFVLMILLFVVSMVKELLEGMRFRPPRFVMTLVPFIFVPYGALVLASFLVGMFKDVGLGAKILGIGTAVWPFSFYIVYIPVALIGCVIFGIAVLVSSIVTYMGKRSQPSQPQDQEADQNGGIRMVTPPRGSQEALTAGSSVADGKVNTNSRETMSRWPVRR
jgi:ABC-type multidrug transport system fused ATPase/permease subunit